MKIEVLYPKVCGLYGDIFNTKYLAECSNDIELINTEIDDTPYFVKHNVNMIYIGSMTEKTEEIVIKKLMPYKKRIEELIDKGVIFLVTGSAIEIFGKSIYRNEKEIEGLNIFDYYTEYDYDNRYHELYLGEFNNMKIVGFKSQFGRLYNVVEKPLFKTLKGIGNNEKDINEGVLKNNFMATTVLGPIILQNPLFAKYILDLLGVKKDLKYKKTIDKAYSVRLKEYEDLKF